MTMKRLYLNESQRVPLLKDHEGRDDHGVDARQPSNTHPQPHASDASEKGTVFFIGTATTIIEWQGFRILTDPNFLHAGDRVHLGPGVNATRRTQPAKELNQLPALDCILLSHYHEDHFDRHVEKSLNREFPIVTSPHAASCLTGAEGEDQPFQQVTGLSVFESAMLHIEKQRAVKVTAMPGKHVPPGPISVANDFLQAVPPSNGWLLDFGQFAEANQDSAELQVRYSIYISGDTLFVDDLQEIPKWLSDKQLDLMLVHLGGTTVLGPSLPLLMITMDGKQGRQLMQLLDPKITIPIHYDDYDVFQSPLVDFKNEVDGAALRDHVVYLDRGEAYSFDLRQ